MHECNSLKIDLPVLPHEAVDAVPHPSLRLAGSRLDPLYPLPRPHNRLDPPRNERYRNLASVNRAHHSTYRSVSVRVYRAVHAVALDPAVSLRDEDALGRRRGKRLDDVAFESYDAFRRQQFRVQRGPGVSLTPQPRMAYHNVTTSPRRSLPRVSYRPWLKPYRFRSTTSLPVGFLYWSGLKVGAMLPPEMLANDTP